MTKLVLLRHGESLWNQENRFTGWTDVDLSDRGVAEARDAGRRLRAAGFGFDIAYTSYLKRAVRTLWLVQEEMDLMQLPVATDWRLNERHYGALQGLNKKETTQRYGEDQVHQWRRGYAVRPPALAGDDPRRPERDAHYHDIPPGQLPATESLADTLDRVVACWRERILPTIQAGQRVLVVAHGNSLRALVKHLDQVSDAEIMELNIPTGIPLVYEFDAALKVRQHHYLADPAEVQAAAAAVAHQSAA